MGNWTTTVVLACNVETQIKAREQTTQRRNWTHNLCLFDGTQQTISSRLWMGKTCQEMRWNKGSQKPVFERAYFANDQMLLPKIRFSRRLWSLRTWDPCRTARPWKGLYRFCDRLIDDEGVKRTDHWMWTIKLEPSELHLVPFRIRYSGSQSVPDHYIFQLKCWGCGPFEACFNRLWTSSFLRWL